MKMKIKVKSIVNDLDSRGSIEEGVRRYEKTG